MQKKCLYLHSNYNPNLLLSVTDSGLKVKKHRDFYGDY